MFRQHLFTLPLSTALLFSLPASGQGSYNPETQDTKYGNRVITSIRTSSTFSTLHGIPTEPLCLTVLGKGQIVPGSQSEITLSNAQRWTISSPPLGTLGTSDGGFVNGPIKIPLTGAGGRGGKGGIGCLTALYTDENANAGDGAVMPMTVEDCDQSENQVWDASDSDGLKLEAQKGGASVCMTVDSDSVGIRGGEQGDWWKAVYVAPCQSGSDDQKWAAPGTNAQWRKPPCHGSEGADCFKLADASEIM